MSDEVIVTEGAENPYRLYISRPGWRIGVCIDDTVEASGLGELNEASKAAWRAAADLINRGVRERLALSHDLTKARETARASCERCRHYWSRRSLCTSMGDPGRPWAEPSVAPRWCPGFEQKASCDTEEVHS